MPADQVEHGKPTVVANDRFTVDDAGLDGQLLDSGRNEWKAVGEIMAVASYQPNAAAPPMRQDAKAVVLDLVNLARSGRRFIGRARKARFKRGKGPIRLQSAPKFTHC